MKNFTFILMLISTLIFKAHAQVTNTLSNVTISNGNYSASFNNCNTINIVTNNSTTQNVLTLFYTLSRGTNVVTGLGEIKVMLKYNNSSMPTQVGYRQVPEADWVANQAISSVGAVFSNSAVQDSGSSIYVEYKTQGGTIVNSCEYLIVKTPPPPSFSLSPINLSLECGDINAKTFTVTSSNIPSGSVVTYQWNYSGWSGTVNASMSSVSLTPSSGVILPSNVSVTPFVNGVAYPDINCAVVRSSLLNNTTLFGSNNICSGVSSVYTINNLGTNNVVAWSSSNNNVATISNGTQSQVIVNGVTNGTVNLIAKITNQCGQIDEISKVIYVGTTSTFLQLMVGLIMFP